MASKAHNVRLPQEALDRLDHISSVSVRPATSLTVFAVSHALHLAHTDRDTFSAASISDLRPTPGDGRMNLSVSEATLVSLLTSLITTYDEDYKTSVRPHQALRVSLLAWLRSGTDAELIEQVGAPVLPEKVAVMT